jgi:hypothetical protein
MSLVSLLLLNVGRVIAADVPVFRKLSTQTLDLPSACKAACPDVGSAMSLIEASVANSKDAAKPDIGGVFTSMCAQKQALTCLAQNADVCGIQETNSSGFDVVEEGNMGFNFAAMVSHLECFCDACPNAAVDLFQGFSIGFSNFSFAEACPLVRSITCFTKHTQCKAVFSEIGGSGPLKFNDPQAVANFASMCDSFFTTTDTSTPKTFVVTTTEAPATTIASLPTTQEAALKTSIVTTTEIQTLATSSLPTTKAPLKNENFTTTKALLVNNTKSSLVGISSANGLMAFPKQISVAVAVAFAALNLAA